MVAICAFTNTRGRDRNGALKFENEALALPGLLPVAVLYSFFVAYYVSGLTGSVKE
jgi:hypothetical protein